MASRKAAPLLAFDLIAMLRNCLCCHGWGKEQWMKMKMSDGQINSQICLLY